MANASDPRSVLFVVGAGGAMLRYRVRHLEEALRLRGVRTQAVSYRDSRLGRLVERPDVVVLYRVPMTQDLDRLLVRLRRQRPEVPVVFDVDDLVVDEELASTAPALGRLTPDARRDWLRGVQRYRQTLLASDAATVSTSPIADAVVAAGVPAFIVPNGPGLPYLRQAALVRDVQRRLRAEDSLRLGYFSGSPTHDEDWASIEPAVVEFLSSYRGASLLLVGPVRLSVDLADRRVQVSAVPFVAWQRLPALLRGVDLVLAPLQTCAFNDAKSALKWLEAAPLETPCLASPRTGYLEAVEPDRDCLLAETPSQWYDELTRLIQDPDRATRLGDQARASVSRRFDTGHRANAWLTAVAAVRCGARAEVSDPAVPLTVDPPSPLLPEPYPWVDRPRWELAAARVAWRGSQVASYGASAIRHWRRGGVDAVARGTVDTVRRRRAERASATPGRRAT